MSLRRLTPAGRAGVAVLRLDGARERASPLRDAEGRARPWPAPGQVRHVHWWHAGELIDECVAVGRERAVELHVHGGDALLARAAAAWGAGRDGPDSSEPGTDGPASAGTQVAGAEPSGAEPDVPTSLRAAVARASARWGWMAALCGDARAALQRGRVTDELAARVQQALERQTLGRRLVRAARVVLVGPPNAGKSTLFNALLADERALVSARAGTTRDSVEATWQLLGVPLRLIDTAGAYAPADLSGSDLALHVRGPGQPRGRQADDGLAVRTHADLEGVADADVDAAGEFARTGRARLPGERAGTARDAVPGLPGELAVSGRSGAGLEALRVVLAERLGLAGDARDDVRAPLDEATRALLREVQVLARRSD